jgi:uncharacterized membrane protein (DUF4010 family)
VLFRSTATIAAMGARARAEPALEASATAGAVLSTLATVIQLSLVLSATSDVTLARMSAPLVFAGVVATVYGALVALRAWRTQRHTGAGPTRVETPPAVAPADADVTAGATPQNPIDLKAAVLFAGMVTVTMLLSAALHAWFGARGVALAAGATGFADAHSAAASVASLVAGRRLPADAAVVPVLVGLSTNSLSKLSVAVLNGPPRFRRTVGVGLVLVLAALWAGWLVG